MKCKGKRNAYSLCEEHPNTHTFSRVRTKDLMLQCVCMYRLVRRMHRMSERKSWRAPCVVPAPHCCLCVCFFTFVFCQPVCLLLHLCCTALLLLLYSTRRAPLQKWSRVHFYNVILGLLRRHTQTLLLLAIEFY